MVWLLETKNKENSKLCYIVTDSYIVYIETEDIYSDIAKYVETRFDNLNNGLVRPLSKGKK